MQMGLRSRIRSIASRLTPGGASLKDDEAARYAKRQIVSLLTDNGGGWQLAHGVLLALGATVAALGMPLGKSAAQLRSVQLGLAHDCATLADGHHNVHTV
jgi:hypothetical protein